MKSKVFLLLVIVVAGVVLWPAPDPLADVQTVALTSSDGSSNSFGERVMDGFEVALGENRKIKIVSSASQADAIITIEPQDGNIEFSIGSDGFHGSASIRCLVTKNGETSVMFLNITLDENGLKSEIVGRKFWEIWK